MFEDSSPEDPAVAVVEDILTTASNPAVSASLLAGPQPSVAHALWLCACVTFDDHDAPVWLVASDASGLGWCRVPDGTEALDLVDAALSAGGHVEPSEVVSWLHGADMRDRGWYGDQVWGDVEVLDTLREYVR